MQMRLVRIARIRGHVCSGQTVIQQPQRALEPQDPAQSRRPVAVHGGALASHRAGGPPDLARQIADGRPAARLSVTWRSVVSGQGAVSRTGSSTSNAAASSTSEPRRG